jgi:hypothetical protein
MNSENCTLEHREEENSVTAKVEALKNLHHYICSSSLVEA